MSKPQRTPRPPRRYTLPGPCLAWVEQGRDGLWYRVCQPCDTAHHRDHGHRREYDAATSVRAHVRDMAAGRAQWLARVRWHRRAVTAARSGDFAEFGRAIMQDESWRPDAHSARDEQFMIMDDYLRRMGDYV